MSEQEKRRKKIKRKAVKAIKREIIFLIPFVK